MGEILTHDIFKQSQEELYGNLHEVKKKIVAFKAKTSNDDDHDGDSETSTDDDVALMVKKFMKNKGYQGGSSKSDKYYRKNPFAKKKCFECGEWVTSPQIARTRMKIILAIRKSLKARRNCLRNTTRRKMARLVMLSGIQMQVQIPTPMMMRNPPRRVLPVLPSRRLHLYSTHLVVLWQKVNLLCTTNPAEVIRCLIVVAFNI
jgi:hypothetical protein